ncbi:MAG: CAP domain-containing protein [Pseudomonadota bacterium]
MALSAFGASSVAGAPERFLSDHERVWLTQHNKARAQFGSAPLAWNDRLAKQATSWAERLARSNTLRHSSRQQRGHTGENLWMGTREAFTAAQMVDGFIDERVYFVPGRFPDVSRTGRWRDVGHYTQIVWPKTQMVGCALASGARYDVLVCRYWPAGNTIGVEIAPKSRVAAR